MSPSCPAISVVVALLAFLRTSHATAPWAVGAFPKPGDSSTACGSQGLDRVCDPDSVLESDELRLEVQKEIHGLEHRTPHPCGTASVEGFQLAVGIARSIQGGAGSAGAFARGLHDAWGVGHAECNDGLVLLLSIGDRQAHISTGAGVRRILTDDHVEVVIERMRPNLRRAAYGDAVLGAVRDIRSALEAGEGGQSVLSAGVAARRERWGASGVFSGALGLLANPFVVWIGFFVLVSSFTAWSEHKKRARHTNWEAVRARLLEIERLSFEAGAAAPAAAGGTPSAAAVVPASADAAGGEADPAPPPPLAAQMPCCPICLEDFPATAALAPAARALTLPCRHRFHVACLDEWFGTHGRSTCPLCRATAFGDAPPGGGGAAGIQRPGERAGAAAPARRRTPSRGPPGGASAGDQDTACSASDGGAPAAAAAAPDPEAAEDPRRRDAAFLLGRLRWRYPDILTEVMYLRHLEAIDRHHWHGGGAGAGGGGGRRGVEGGGSGPGCGVVLAGVRREGAAGRGGVPAADAAALRLSRAGRGRRGR